MARLSLFIFCLSLFLIQYCRSAAFSSNSFIAPALGTDGNYVIIEYNIAGGQIQAIPLPAGKVCSGCKINMDSTGGIALLPMYTGDNPSFDVYGYGVNLQGVVSETTTLTSQSSTSYAMAMGGQHTWFAVGGDLIYQTRGDTGSGVALSVTGRNITHIQLDGTVLWAQLDTSLQVMDPVITSGNGGYDYIYRSTVAGFHVSSSFFYVLTTSSFIYKYSGLTSPVHSFSIQYSVSVSTLPTIYSMYSIQVSGTTYLLCACRDDTNSYIYRFTDTGSALNSLTLLVTTPAVIYSIGASPKPTCSDTFTNQDETDVDCGGSKCSGCANGKACAGSGDCLSSKCTSNQCVASCTDGIKNQGESDIDCGGPCSKCADNFACSSQADCVSGFCNSTNTCATPTCYDNAVNQDETDVDCGGSTCGTCANGKICAGDEDCLSSSCTNNLCAASCTDHITNQDETDVDCGGDICNKCASLSFCKADSDCITNNCNSELTCTTPTCDDGEMNQNETDIDCGGPTSCNRCSVGQKCENDSDCVSNMCSAVCVTPPSAVPVAQPVATPKNAPIAEQTPDQVPQTSSPESTTPSNTTPSSSSPVTSTPARSLVSHANLVGISVFGTLINFIVMIL